MHFSCESPLTCFPHVLTQAFPLPHLWEPPKGSNSTHLCTGKTFVSLSIFEDTSLLLYDFKVTRFCKVVFWSIGLNFSELTIHCVALFRYTAHRPDKNKTNKNLLSPDYIYYSLCVFQIFSYTNAHQKIHTTYRDI